MVSALDSGLSGPGSGPGRGDGAHGYRRNAAMD